MEYSAGVFDHSDLKLSDWAHFYIFLAKPRSTFDLQRTK